MSLSPPRAFALGACSIIALAGAFVAGIGVAERGHRVDAHRMDADGIVSIDCPEPLDATATRAALDRARSCRLARDVQDLLVSSGATAANVQVVDEPTAALLGPETTPHVIAQVFLPGDLERRWNVDAAAAAISRLAGTPRALVTITDDELAVLYETRPARPAPGPPRRGGEPVRSRKPQSM